MARRSTGKHWDIIRPKKRIHPVQQYAGASKIACKGQQRIFWCDIPYRRDTYVFQCVGLKEHPHVCVYRNIAAKEATEANRRYIPIVPTNGKTLSRTMRQLDNLLDNPWRLDIPESLRWDDIGAGLRRKAERRPQENRLVLS